jgi:hypothetical protein
MSCSHCHCECVVLGETFFDNQASKWCDLCNITQNSSPVGFEYNFIDHTLAASFFCEPPFAKECSAISGRPYAFDYDGPSVFDSGSCWEGPRGELPCPGDCRVLEYERPTETFGVCCAPQSVIDRLFGAISGCEVYTGQGCCSNIGGTWHGTLPSAIGSCLNNCPAAACCGCDWCCDEMDAPTCIGHRNYPWENLPIHRDRSCVGNICPTSPPLPVCRREEFVYGKRPNAHKNADTCGGAAVDRGGRHELHSVGVTRAKDCAPGVDQCRTHYAHLGRGGGGGAAPSTKHTGWLCGQFNRRVATTKRANSCYLSKRPDGRHSFHCAYRVPCPEKPAVCL